MGLKDTIIGKPILSIYMQAGDIYPIQYSQIASANIVNYTDGAIFVSEKNDFTLNDNIGEYLVITDGNGYNEYYFYKSGTNTLYIKADAEGYICIVQKRW